MNKKMGLRCGCDPSILLPRVEGEKSESSMS